MKHGSRTQTRLIPTERCGLSVGLGALVSCSIMLAAYPIAGYFFALVVVWCFFLCGCVASILFGTHSPGGVGDSLVTGGVAGTSFYAFVFLLTIGWVFEEGFSLKLGVSYAPILLYAFTLAGAVLLTVIGAIFGWLIAQVIGR